jgi:hypothetical protein
VVTSPLREGLLADLDAVGGWPQQPRRIAVSCGRGDGLASDATPGAPALRWSDDPFLAVTVNTLPGTVAEGGWLLGELSPLEAADLPPWDSAPGAQGDYHGRIAAIAAGFGCGSVEHSFDTTCSVPTVNALALDGLGPFDPVPEPSTGASPFHDYVCSPSNMPHLAIAPEVRDWLLAQIGEPPDG